MVRLDPRQLPADSDRQARAWHVFASTQKSFIPSCRFTFRRSNFDPSAPEVPLSTPASYSRQMAAAIGPFYTQRHWPRIRPYTARA